MNSGKAWGGRFQERAASEAERYTASLPFDRRLWREDLAGSRAHVRMLGRQGILVADEVELILSGLDEVGRELAAWEAVQERSARDEDDPGQPFSFRIEDEDIHMSVERRLTELIGPVGGKLHTARSRNDQVVLDMHLWARTAARRLQEGIAALQQALLEQAEQHVDDVLPGYTHLQHAQPVRLSHHLLAFFAMLQRDRERLARVSAEADRMPLGAGALAGSPWPIDPEQVASELGFSRLYENSMDAVADRDFLVELLGGCALCMAHLSRLAETLVLWSSREFGFVELSDAYATGSSMMPQKKNPDVAELARGKSGRVYGDLLALLTVLKGLPLAYGSDLQEDKEAVFDAVDTVAGSLAVLTGALATARFRPERMAAALTGDFSTATELADHLAAHGLPFREAHRVAGEVVAWCIDDGRTLESLSLAELRQFSPLFDEGVLTAVLPTTAADRRESPGGTGRHAVAAQLEWARRSLVGAGENH